MTRLFLHCPLFIAARGKQIARLAAQHFFQAGGSSAEPYAKIGKQVRGKGEFEFSLEPQAGVWHRGIVDGDAGAWECGEGHTKSVGGQIGRAWRKALAFAAFVAGFDAASVPFFVFRVGGAEPALAPIAENRSGFVAGFIQWRNAFAHGLNLLLARGFPCGLRFHGAPARRDCTPADCECQNFLWVFGDVGWGVLGFGCAKKTRQGASQVPA